MKAAGAAISAIIVGIILFIAQDYYVSLKNTDKYSMQVDKQDYVIDIKTATMKSIVKPTGGRAPESIRFAFVTVKNIGTEPLTDQEVRLSAQTAGVWRGIVESGDVSFSGDEINDLRYKLNTEGLTISYKLLNPGDHHKFWVAYESLENLKFFARRAGLKLTIREAQPTDFTDGSYTFWQFFKDYVLLIIVGFLAGMIVVGVMIDSELKKRGIDMSKLPKGVNEVERER